MDVDALSEDLSTSETGTAARRALERALREDPDPSGHDRRPARPAARRRLFGSQSIPAGASSRPLSDADLAIQTGVRNSRYSVTELIELNGDADADRASLALLCLTVASSLSAVAASNSLPGPEILRFVVVWFLSFAPLAFVGAGLAAPDGLQSALVAVQRSVFPSYRKRMVQHEAGHFLLGHLLGMPIRGYRANAVKNAVEFYPLGDADVGRERARSLGFDGRGFGSADDAEGTAGGGQTPVYRGEDKPFFSEDGGGADVLLQRSVFRDAKNYTDNPFLKVGIPEQDDPVRTWPYRGFDDAALDRLAVVSVAGVCSEILAFGNAEGGYADLSQLRGIFASASDDLTVDEGDAERRVRFALGYAAAQLRRHLGALDALADVMERGGTVAECVLAIETCENVNGNSAVNLVEGNYERDRRDKIRSEGVGWVESLLLEGGKNADREDDRVVEGKGGGDRKKKFELTGDDPLYAALAVALAFFLWAGNGGLSLH